MISLYPFQFCNEIASSFSGEFESNTTHSNPASPTLPGSAARTSDHTLVSLGLFFTTGRKGYLYDLMNTPKLLTEYDFTDACISACLTRTLLHVVTNNGLESYTVRLYASASQAARTYHCEDSLQHTYSQSKSFYDGVLLFKRFIYFLYSLRLSFKREYFFVTDVLL